MEQLPSDETRSEPPAGPPRQHILLVEDDAGIATEVAAELEARGYGVTAVGDGAAALEQALAGGYDLLVVDRLLPGMDGVEVIRRVREENLHTPVLVLSALSAVDERVRGLKAGGDDYLTKPFALPELAARVEALLRRPAETRETVLRVGDLMLDLIDREAWRNGRRIELLPREFKLLEYLMRRHDQVVTRAMLLEDVWHYRFVPQTNLVDVHIGKLRRKLDAPGEAPLIESVWGTGFALREPNSADHHAAGA
ncbi:MAG TPA: response regulator transcription factor [Acetobacteraceae bacterium]|nr:response regulator transcription factor [Acetobacteraceae bacterium]